MSREVMQQALEALENSVDLVINEARDAEKMYANVPTKIARVRGIADLVVAHVAVITAIKEALAQPEQEPVIDYKAAYYSLLEKYDRDVLAEQWTPDDTAHRPGGLAQPEQDQTEIAFEAWWQAHGQYCRAGGGDYEKTFAYRAWMASLAIPEKPEHPKQMARLGWQYVECPACGSEGARAFPKPEQEPMVTKNEKGLTLHVGWDDLPAGTKLYASPPQRQPLTDEQIAEIAERMEATDVASSFWRDFVRAVEAAHGTGEKT